MKCLDCNKEFDYPEFQCGKRPGPHKLEAKTYYHPGGQSVQSIRDRGFFGPHIVLVPGTARLNNANGNFERMAAVEVQFVKGKFTTSNAEEQYYLDRKDGLCDEATWEKIYFTPEQQVHRANEKLADITRKIAEQNSLLDQVKQKVGARA